jgi:hypothetical protein
MRDGVVYWYDLVTLKRKGGGHEHDHGQRGAVVCMPNKGHVGRANGTVLAAGGGLHIVYRSTFRPGDIIAQELDVSRQIEVITGVSRALDLVHFDDRRRWQ